MPVRGQAGGRATVKKHGRQWMAEIGRRGFATFTERYFDGDKAAATAWLRLRSYEAQAMTHAERELQRRVDAGAKVASVELPVYDLGDEDVPL